MQEKIAALVETINRETTARYLAEGMDPSLHMRGGARSKERLKYFLVDVSGSGVYMVDKATGEIFGIKAYGKIHRGHRYGTLDTIQAWNWGGFKAVSR